MLKRISAVLLAVVMLFTMASIATVAYAAEDVAALAVAADKETVKRGEDVTFTVSLANATKDLTGLVVDVEADADLVYKSYTALELNGNNEGTVIDEEELEFGWITSEDKIADVGEELCSITFTAKADATLGDAAVTATATSATYNEDTTNVDVAVTAGTETVAIECAHNFDGAEWAQPAEGTAKEDAKHTRECVYDDCEETEEADCQLAKTGVTKHTETVDGAVHWTCGVCGYTCDTPIPAGHDIVIRYKAATATVDGEWQEYCTICEEVIGEPTVITAGHPGKDTTSGWFYGQCMYAKATGLMKGDANGNFNPNALITRAEVAVIVAKIYYGADSVPAYDPAKTTFTDVPATHWGAKFIQGAAEQGIIKGSAGKFRPGDNITNQEIAVMFKGLCRALEKEDLQFAAAGNVTDITTAPAWAQASLTWAVDSGLMVGSGGLVKPLENHSRAQMATLVRKFDKANRGVIEITE